MALTRVSPALFQVSNNITSVTVGGSANTISLTFDSNGVITGATNNAVSVANTAITGNIISSQIAPSVTLTTPLISGNLNLDSTGTSGIRLTSANTITFHTTGTEDVRIDANGNVGIGTASPTGKLDVSSSSAGVTAGDLVVDTANKTVYVGRQSSAGGDNSYLVVRGRLNGNTANQALVITGDTTAYGTGLFRPNNDKLGFSTLSTERMRIDGDVVQVGNNAGTGEVFAQNTVKVWGSIQASTGTFYTSFGASSISKISTGIFAIVFTRTLSSGRFGSAGVQYNSGFTFLNTESTTGVRVNVQNSSGTLHDQDNMFLIAGGS